MSGHWVKKKDVKIGWTKDGGVVITSRTGRQQTVSARGSITVVEVAVLMGVSRTAVYKWVRSGKLEWSADGNSLRGSTVAVSALRKFAVEQGFFMGAAK